MVIRNRRYNLRKSRHEMYLQILARYMYYTHEQEASSKLYLAYSMYFTFYVLPVIRTFNDIDAIEKILAAYIAGIRLGTLNSVVGMYGSNPEGGLLDPPTTSWIGVPDPVDSFIDYDPLTATRPADPAGWPASEVAGYYYIDASDGAASDANTYGYPNVPRLTPPTGTVAAGSVIVFGGGSYASAFTATFNGTSANPIFIVGEDAAKTLFTANINFSNGSSHVILDNFKWTDYGDSPDPTTNCSYITIRNCEFSGPGTFSGFANVLNPGGASGNENSYIIYYNNLIQDYGDWQAPSENDYHGISWDQYAQHVWILNNTIRRMGGDGVQVGEVYSTGLPRYVYIAGNDISQNLENAIDIKDSLDVVISQNTCHTFVGDGVQSFGEAIVIQETSTARVWVLYNEVYNCNQCVEITETPTDVRIIGNIFRDTTGTVTSGPLYDENTGVVSRATAQSDVHIVDNIFYNVGIGIQAFGTTCTSITGNIFASRNTTSGYSWDIVFENTSGPTAATVDYNSYEDINNYVSGATYATMSAWTTAYPAFDGSSVEGSPSFTDAVNDDYTLQAGSNCLDANNANAIYDEFYTLYSISIKTGANGVSRPATAGDWDIGCNERQ